MLKFINSPVVSFWVAFIVAVDSAVAGGTVHLTNAIPDAWIPVVTAWASIVATIGGTWLAAVHAVAMQAQK